MQNIKNEPGILVCQRCGHKWYKRTQMPGQCPGCGSAKWQIPRTKNELGRKPKEGVK